VDLATLALLTSAATVAGFIDAIAGGGGLITLPALLLAGVPPAQAIATNKLQGTFGVASASYRFWRAGEIDFKLLKEAVVATAAGAAIGAFAITQVDPAFLKPVMPWALLAAALYFALAPFLRDHSPRAALSPFAFALAAAGPVGLYDGFFGPGAGSLYTLAFLAVAGVGMIAATARAKVLNFTSNIVSLGVFLVAGQVDFAIGLPMAAGQAAGAWLGTHMALKHGVAIIRPLLVITTGAAALKLLFDR
jgi:uncharacterized membrane protein YfcA